MIKRGADKGWEMGFLCGLEIAGVGGGRLRVSCHYWGETNGVVWSNMAGKARF